MALFKVLRGSSGSFHDDLSQFHNWGADGSATLISNGAIALNPKFNDGFCYFLKDSRMFYIDYAIKDGNGNITQRHRVPLNADDAQSIENTIINRLEITDSDYEIPTAKLIKEEIARIDLLISQIGGDAIEALQNNKMDKEDPTGTGSFSMNGGKATGTNSVAWADASNTPEYTTASGYNAFAMGLGSTASGHLSFARGETAIASGDYSHADGYHVNATQSYAHAEGNNTTASAQGAHAEGEYTTASGQDAHTEGYYTEAQGKFSHAEGNYTTATHKSQHVEGEWNALDTSTNAATDRGTYVHITGIGTDESNRKNGFTVDWNGNLWGARSIAHGNNVSASGENSYAGGNTVVASGVAAHAEGDQTAAEGIASHSEGSETVAEGNYAHSEGHITEAIGSSSHSEGKLTSATGDYSHSGGYNTIASGSNSFASGSYTIAKGSNSFATGQGNYKALYFTGAANSTTYTISDSVSIDYEYIQGLTISGGGFRQEQVPPSSIDLKQSSDKEEYHDHRTVNDTKIYTLNPGYTFFFSGNCSDACLFEEKHPLSGGTFVQSYNIRSGVLIDRTAATSIAFLTVKAAEVTWATHLRYAKPISTRYWQARYDWHQEDIQEFPVEAFYFVPTSSNIPSGSYVSSSYSGLVQIKSQSGSTVTLSKTLSSEDIVNISHYVILSDRCASGNYSFIAGCKNKASSSYTASLGYNNTSSGTAAFTVGENNTASGTDSFAIGSHTTVSGAQSFATGLYTTASGTQQAVFGKYNATDTNAALIIGNGTSASNKKNAFTVSKTGVVYAQNRLNIAGLDLEQDAAGYTLFVNGPAFFSGTVKAAEPIAANDLTTKNYVDNNLPRMTHSWITATAGQSEFDFATPDDGCVAVADLADYYYIYFNGLLLIPDLHYSISGSIVTFIGWAAEAGDVCHIVGFKPINPTV